MWQIRLVILGYGLIAAALNAEERVGLAVGCGLAAIVVPWALGRYGRRVAREIAADYARTIALRRRLASAEKTCPSGCRCRTRRPSGSK